MSQSVAHFAQPTRGRPPVVEPTDPHEWFSIWKHLILAAALWAVIPSLLSFALAVNSIGVMGGLVLLLAGPHLAGMACATVGGITILFFALVNATIGIRLPTPLVGGFTGGWIGGGYVSLCLAAGGMMPVDWTRGFDPVVLLWIVPATVMGTYAGAIGGWRASNQLRFREPLSPFKFRVVSYTRERTHRLQFGIRQMLIASAWLCGILGVARMLGLLTPHYLIAMSLWLVVQLVTVVIGAFVWPLLIAFRLWMWQRW